MAGTSISISVPWPRLLHRLYLAPMECSLVHADESEVTWSSPLSDDVFIYTLAIITNAELQKVLLVKDLHFDGFCIGVFESIMNRLLPDA